MQRGSSADWMPEEDCASLPREVVDISINPRMNLIALTLTNNSVAVFGHGLKQLWSIPSPDGSRPCVPAWRNDGALVAIGYESGKCMFYDTDRPTPIHSTTVRDKGEPVSIKSLCWYHHHYYFGPRNMSRPIRNPLYRIDQNIAPGFEYMNTLIVHGTTQSSLIGQSTVVLIAGGIQTLARTQLQYVDQIIPCVEQPYVFKATKSMPESLKYFVWLDGVRLELWMPISSGKESEIDADLVRMICTDMVPGIYWVKYNPLPIKPATICDSGWMDWCKEPWSQLNDVASYQQKFQEFNAALRRLTQSDTDHDEPMTVARELLTMMSLGTTATSAAKTFLQSILTDSDLSASAVIVMNNSLNKMSFRLCELLRAVHRAYRGVCNVVSLVEMHSKALMTYSDSIKRVQLTIGLLGIKIMELCEVVQFQIENAVPFFRWLILTGTRRMDLAPTISPDLLVTKIDAHDKIEQYIVDTFSNPDNLRVDCLSQYFQPSPLSTTFSHLISTGSRIKAVEWCDPAFKSSPDLSLTTTFNDFGKAVIDMMTSPLLDDIRRETCYEYNPKWQMKTRIVLDATVCDSKLLKKLIVDKDRRGFLVLKHDLVVEMPRHSASIRLKLFGLDAYTITDGKLLDEDSVMLLLHRSTDPNERNNGQQKQQQQGTDNQVTRNEQDKHHCPEPFTHGACLVVLTAMDYIHSTRTAQCEQEITVHRVGVDASRFFLDPAHRILIIVNNQNRRIHLHRLVS